MTTFIVAIVLCGMPQFLNDFIIPALNDGRYNEKLRWIDEAESVFVVRWQHKSTSTWNESDTVVFQDWDKLKGHYSPEAPDYLTKSKQRFRAALYKLANIIELTMPRFSKEENFKCYKILNIDKKSQRIMKKKRNMKQRRSFSSFAHEVAFSPLPQEVSLSPVPQEVPFSPSTKEVACSPMKEDTDMLSPRAQQLPTPPTQDLSFLLDPHLYELSLENVHLPSNFSTFSIPPGKEHRYKYEHDYCFDDYRSSVHCSNFPFDVSLHSTPCLYKSYDSYNELYTNGITSSGFYDMDICDKEISLMKDQDSNFQGMEDVKLFL